MRFFTGANTFWVVQNNKPVIYAINGLNKRRKATCVSTFYFPTLYTKLPHNKLLIVRNSLIDFCFDGGEYKYITVNNYGTCWVNNIKDNVICLNKQQIKDAVAYLLLNGFTVGLRSSVRLLVFLWGLIQLLFFANLFLYFYESKWMNELKKNDLIKARKLCNIFRFIDDLNSINYGGEFESNYSNIYPAELQLGKENTDKHETSFLDLNIKIEDGKFQFGHFDKRDSFPFSIARMSDNLSNVPSSIVYSAIGAESLRIARASNNPEHSPQQLNHLLPV